MKLSGLPTPALVLDRKILNKNIEAMNKIIETSTLKLRPHYKSHKCAALAKIQIEHGAIGLTCAKLSEAEDLCDIGIEDILIANQVVDPVKIRKLADLANNSRLTVCVDNIENISALSSAAKNSGSTIHCLIEYDIGMDRCGVVEKEDVLILAKHIANCDNLVFDGLQAYAGHISHIEDINIRKQMTSENFKKLKDLISYLNGNGITVKTVSGGISPQNFRWNLRCGESFSTPELVISFSDSGLNGLSQNFHALIKNRVCRGVYRDKKRPVLLNLWEACYFDFTDETIKSAADSAADLGVELLVIDDCWFGKRNNDRSSLGDWYVNEDKIKCGLKSLCEYVNNKGLMLGIWFEPEMISPDSELIKKYPEWVMQINGRKPTETRWQLMLDLTNPEVQDYIYDSISNILKTANIEYIKWDYNRTMSHIGSTYLKTEQMGEYYHRYILGLYSVLDRLTTDFPCVLFEGCASGGGRFDMGMLYYTPQIWTSDDTDAVERAEIQYGTSLIYPMSCQSAHVSVCPNHQTGRTVSMQARHIFALTGSFGYELAPEKICDTDRKYIKEFIKFYNENFDVFQNGKYYRLTNPKTDDYAAFQYVYKNRVIVGVMRLKTHAINLQTTIKLKGLDKNHKYTDKESGEQYYGSQLMQFGISLKASANSNDYYAVMCEFESCDKSDG